MPILRLLSLLSISLFFSACATQSPLPGDGDGWRARGKFSFSSSEARESGNFDWRQNGESYQVRLFGPLGFGTVRIEGDDHQVVIQSAKQERYSEDPDSLIYQMTGMHLPITDIPGWLRGDLEAIDAENIQIDGLGNLVQAAVDGWEISYSNHSVDRLPGRIEATQPGTEFTLVVSDWGG